MNIAGLSYKGFECVYLNQQGIEEKVKTENFEDFEQNGLSIDFKSSKIAFDEKIKVSLKTNQSMELRSCKMIFSFDYSDVLHVFCNGFQSWTHTATFSKDTQFKQPKSPFRELMANYGDYTIIRELKLNNHLYSWTYGYLKLRNKNILFIGSLSDREGYKLIEWDVPHQQVIVHVDVAGKVAEGEVSLIDLFIGVGNENIITGSYFKEMKMPHPSVKTAIGWTSWYYYYTNISEKIILDNLNAYTSRNIPIDYFQIDDGYQSKLGDWLTPNEKFPNGMKSIATEIRNSGIQSGIWLAPFICDIKSKIATDHPDWLLKDKTGKLIKIGYNPLWSGWYYALNFYHPGVREYLKKVFDTIVCDWGFDMVKLDFLFAVAVQPLEGKSRGQVMHEAMDFLRECVGSAKILGCGVPLSPAFATTDYCRIGPDVHLKWDFTALRWIRNRERPSCINAIQNSIHRRHLNKKAFLNDTDVFILRDNKNVLSLDEKYSQLLSNIIFGDLIFTSDHIGEYKEETLSLYKSIFPLCQISQLKVEQSGLVYKVRFMIKESIYLAYLNLSDERSKVKLEDGWFFNCRTQNIVEGDTMYPLEKHQSVCFHQIDESPYAVIGSKGHFFSGSEVESISLVDDNIEVEINNKLLVPVTLYLKTPKETNVKTINHRSFTLIPKRDFNLVVFNYS